MPLTTVASFLCFPQTNCSQTGMLNIRGSRGATSSSFWGRQFSRNFIRWRHRAYSTVVQLFRKRSHIIIMDFCPQTRSPEYQDTHSAQRCLNKNRQNRRFYNNVGGWITGVKRNFWLHAICACTEQHSTYHRRWENWWLGLRIWCLAKCVGLGFMLQLEKEQ